jgi:hypothetical protein
MKIKKKFGRPSKYKKIDPAIIAILCQAGLTDVQMSKALQVTERTWNNWKNKNLEFFQSLKTNKAIADGRIEASLFQRAEGYSHPEDKIFLGKDNEPVIVHTTKHYPPDTAAAFIWLKNRKGWKDKVDMEAKVTEMPPLDYSKLSTKKLKLLKALMEEAKPVEEEENNG